MKKDLCILLAAFCVGVSNAQVLKTNVTYDATATMNIGAEFRLGGRTSLDLPFNYNALEFGNDRHWKHFLAQPSLRVWTREAFGGPFFGVHGHWAYYNIGRAPLSDYMRAHNFAGSLYGGGVSWGYRWNWGGERTRPWGMEVELGVGYARLDYNIYKCGRCGDLVKRETKNYFGPTKLAVNLVYAFGGNSGNPRRAQRAISIEILDVVASQNLVRVQPQADTLLLHGLAPTFVVPDPEGYKQRTDSLRADIEFVFDVSQLDPRYRNNADELRRLNMSMGDISRSRHTKITSIDIVGFASPEGSEEYNIPLSERRAESVKEYLEVSTGVSDVYFSTRGEGERPDGLRALVVVNYTVEPLSLENIERALRTSPQMLSVEEMFRLAWTFEPESDEYREIFEIAAATFPDDDDVNINAAGASLLHGDADGAMRYLERCRDKTLAWWNNLGIVFFLRGEMERAAAAFINAEEAGVENAAALENFATPDDQQLIT
jgi:outer membrane protein OmpA-like peptidoglycan-associated protein